MILFEDWICFSPFLYVIKDPLRQELDFLGILGKTIWNTNVWSIFWKKSLFDQTSWVLFQSFRFVRWWFFGYIVCGFKSSILCFTENFRSLRYPHIEGLNLIHKTIFFSYYPLNTSDQFNREHNLSLLFIISLEVCVSGMPRCSSWDWKR